MVLWIFGYASLLWKTGFHYDERIVGFIKGYRRVFHLACYEHRGTPQLPARVPTLEPEDDAVCWGAAYCINSPEAAARAMEYLHVRESEYDVLSTLEFFTEDSPNQAVIPEIVVFMSTLDKQSNKYYLGPAPAHEMARQIATAAGPCGPNADYIFRLVDALREIGHEDAEVVELSDAVRKVAGDLKKAQVIGGKVVSVGPPPHTLLTASMQAQISPRTHQPQRGSTVLA